MFGPFISRLVFRTLGIALLVWSLVRIYIAIELYRTLPPGGEFTPWVAMFAFVIAVWGIYDLLSSVSLIAVRNWAKYLAFISFAVHGACGYLLFYEHTRELAIGIIATSATCAALLVLCGDLNDPDKQPEP